MCEYLLNIYSVNLLLNCTDIFYLFAEKSKHTKVFLSSNANALGSEYFNDKYYIQPQCYYYCYYYFVSSCVLPNYTFLTVTVTVTISSDSALDQIKNKTQKVLRGKNDCQNKVLITILWNNLEISHHLLVGKLFLYYRRHFLARSIISCPAILRNWNRNKSFENCFEPFRELLSLDVL